MNRISDVRRAKTFTIIRIGSWWWGPWTGNMGTWESATYWQSFCFQLINETVFRRRCFHPSFFVFSASKSLFLLPEIQRVICPFVAFFICWRRSATLPTNVGNSADEGRQTCWRASADVKPPIWCDYQAYLTQLYRPSNTITSPVSASQQWPLWVKNH